MKKENIYSDNRNLWIYIAIFISAGLLLIDGFGDLKVMRSAISYAFEPLTTTMNSAGNGTREYLSAFAKLGEFTRDYNNLKVELYQKEAEYSNYLILKNENEALKNQLNVKESDVTYIMANTVRDNDIAMLLLDKGSKDGIQQGDVVLLGNVFLGIVTRVDENGSAVRLPVNESSHLEVAILKADDTSQENILSNGVVSGSAAGIKLENISMNSDVADGDVVYVNDSRVGGFLVLGYVVGLSTNPASTYKTAYVSPVLDYDQLITVFVKLD